MNSGEILTDAFVSPILCFISYRNQGLAFCDTEPIINISSVSKWVVTVTLIKYVQLMNLDLSASAAEVF
ncbi:hypothetical protein ACIQD3_20515 [Peribacillus loiseleuriae]|uniref:hypothetical protein n=1 Tax=Peribacillus loiseleuriae TaxID=1679170 RepID=UPI00382BE8E2